ncbi:MarR family winged helix-turn-helix transcriptional regulator [Agromyces sp. G08B096]|uniref:MarR family winged helix-turn-helix transcriptional regulator n=1 Tax=Agromyces sp. G08B096 TaxID=3156399 RepID=A0AAU7WAU0_9MICO
MTRRDDAAGILRELIVISRRGVADARTARIRLSLTDQSILGYIVDHPGARSTDIATAFRLNRSTVSRQLANLARLGVVRERADEASASSGAGGAPVRGRPLELTDTGWAAYHEAIAILQSVVDHQLGDWTDAEVARFARDLHRFNTHEEEGTTP